VDMRYLRDAQTRNALAQEFRNMVLRRRTMDQETFAMAFIYSGWFKSFKVPASELHILTTRLDARGLAEEPAKTEVIFVDTIWQDGQRILCAPVVRSEGSPTLGQWHDMSAGTVAVRNRFWHAIAPTLAAPAYAEAVLAAFEGGTDRNEGLTGGAAQ
jgi:hypothetical protein